MSVWQTVGEYLEREVEFLAVNALADFRSHPALSRSLVMVCLQEGQTDSDYLTSFFDTLADNLPLVIAVSGSDASEVFHHLLHYLSEKPLPVHIMTKLCDQDKVSAALQDFFGATWPSDERYDDWKAYSIVAVGDELFQSSVFGECVRLLGFTHDTC